MCVETVAEVMVRQANLCREDSTAGDVRQIFADDHVHAAVVFLGFRLYEAVR